jgi:hypothetical protein
MTTTQRNRAIELAIVPRAPRLPTDRALLHGSAVLAFCPVPGAARRARADHIACLISETLVAAGV